ncbi:MAG TPA: M23 family metallopeptidase, partial [Prolixibacteraceae bacterium]|nr:M23 family metallopeptidase [Prolixibacteraceae bacterium]
KRTSKKYRLTITDNFNYTQVFSMNISKLKFWLYNFLILILGIALAVVLIFFTPLKRSVPGYPSGELSKMMTYHSMMVDSLANEIQKRDAYLQNIRTVISGGIVEDTSFAGKETANVELRNVQSDSIFNELVGPDKYKFSYLQNPAHNKLLSELNFFTPVQGVVVNRFHAAPGHFGTDIVAKENSNISAVLDGTVVFAEWSVATGYVVQIQHNNNIISIYKHNSDITVRPGDRVNAGDIIAIMGNEGKYSTGPHLHIEIWQNGMPVDPEAYINF